MANTNLTSAKNAKNDEFYTQYHDIEKEINAYLDFNTDVFQNFEPTLSGFKTLTGLGGWDKGLV